MQAVRGSQILEGTGQALAPGRYSNCDITMCPGSANSCMLRDCRRCWMPVACVRHAFSSRPTRQPHQSQCRKPSLSLHPLGRGWAEAPLVDAPSPPRTGCDAPVGVLARLWAAGTVLRGARGCPVVLWGASPARGVRRGSGRCGAALRGARALLRAGLRFCCASARGSRSATGAASSCAMYATSSAIARKGSPPAKCTNRGTGRPIWTKPCTSTVPFMRLRHLASTCVTRLINSGHASFSSSNV